MRSIFLAALFALLALPGWSSASAQLAEKAERISSPRALDDGMGVVVMSVRSELYLDEPLDIYFLREGGSVSNPADVVTFERRQGMLAFGNDTVKYKVRAYQLAPGTYRLVAHGMECPKVPAENERCLIDHTGLLGTEEISRPSRGYGENAPTFEVRAGSVTWAGDFALTARNTVEWSEVPRDVLDRSVRSFRRLPSAPPPVVPEEFKLIYGLHPRSYEDDRYRRY